ncbi:MAG: MSMEG_1061 family FMN-dependent PPOX-type flavoprotein [Myxococcota bacterium]
MPGRDDHCIENVDALRALVGELAPGVGLKLQDALDEFASDFIARSPFLVLSTSDSQGRLDASPKGDAPGFVQVEDEHTLVIPDRLGNRLVFGHLNILENPRVGVLFLIPGTNETLRVNGRAELTQDPALLERLAARGRPAVLAIRVHVEEAFFPCAKAFLRSELWKPDTWPERRKISFGRMLARKLDAGDDVAEKIDAAVAENYRTDL